MRRPVKAKLESNRVEERRGIALTRHFSVLQRRKFFLGKDPDDDQVPDVTCFAPDLGSPHGRMRERERFVTNSMSAKRDPMSSSSGCFSSLTLTWRLNG